MEGDGSSVVLDLISTFVASIDGDGGEDYKRGVKVKKIHLRTITNLYFDHWCFGGCDRRHGRYLSTGQADKFCHKTSRHKRIWSSRFFKDIHFRVIRF